MLQFGAVVSPRFVTQLLIADVLVDYVLATAEVQGIVSSIATLHGVRYDVVADRAATSIAQCVFHVYSELHVPYCQLKPSHDQRPLHGNDEKVIAPIAMKYAAAASKLVRLLPQIKAWYTSMNAVRALQACRCIPIYSPLSLI